jgi:diguanylate cyclase (GGDEF)-like protein
MKSVSVDPIHGYRLLIVDDDTFCLRLLHVILADVAEVFIASSGEEALRQIEKHAPDLVLLDADMPGIGGYSTCTALKANPDTADLPIIFITSHVDTDSETKALALGAVDFIHKPVNPPVVVARVKTHLALKQKSDALRRLTAVDALTGIANRRAFDDSLNREWRRAMRSHEPLSLLMLDIDYFKRYNDAYGHQAGDACLQQVARALGDSTQRAGDVTARYGGEEFAVILPHTSPADAQAIAERLCRGVRSLGIPHRDSPVAPQVTISVGVASLFVPCTGDQINDKPCLPCHLFDICRTGPVALLALADQALYAAKRNGRDTIVSLAGTPDPAVFPADAGFRREIDRDDSTVWSI